MTAMTCAELHEVACELALDLLGGVERASALTHLETCPPCRHEVAALTEITEDILFLSPVAEPSAYFATGVLARIHRLNTPTTTTARDVTPARRRRHWARPARVLATAAIAIAIIVVTFVVRIAPDGDRAVAAVADMRTATGEDVGSVSLQMGEPASLTVSVPGWIDLVRSYGEPVDATYWLFVEHDDGSRQLYPLEYDADYEWVIPLDVDPGALATVSVLDDKGRQWCSADFTV
jgi:hypothetical protein